MWNLTKLFIVSFPVLVVPFLNLFPSSSEKRKINQDLSKLKREYLFDVKEIQTEQLNSLLESKYNNPTKLQISEKRIETTLVPFLKEKLGKIFLAKGLNFQDLKGRIYFSIKDLTIEILILWREYAYFEEFTHFDRFSITLDV